jgi:hypothetical protein
MSSSSMPEGISSLKLDPKVIISDESDKFFGLSAEQIQLIDRCNQQYAHTMDQ